MSPSKTSPGAFATDSASATAAAPAGTPTRRMPTSYSTSTCTTRPAAMAAEESAATCDASSTATVSRTSRGSAMTRERLGAPTGGCAQNRSRHTVAMTSSSRGVAQVSPVAPAATCRRATADALCVFTCGRSAMPCDAAYAAALAMLCDSRSRSTTAAGVATASGSAVTASPAGPAPRRWWDDRRPPSMRRRRTRHRAPCA